MKKVLSVLLSVMTVFSCFFCLDVTNVSANCSASDVLSVATGEVGVTSGYHQRNKYTLWLGKISGYEDSGYGYPWCSTFVSWCANQAGCLDVITKTASCNVQWANTAGNKHYTSQGYIPKPGDLIFFDYGASHSANSLDHVGFVEYYDSATGIVHTIEGNYSNSVARVNRSYNSNDIYGFVSPNYTPQESGNDPIGEIDSVTGGANTVTVRGWAFDVDDINTQLNIHVYIGGSADDANVEGIGWITANTYRPDVDDVFGCGGYHGYEVTIPTSKTGTQPVYIYAINVGSGANKLLGYRTVNISKDTESPTITSRYLSQISKDGYRVCCIPSDNVGIKRVRIATWTQSNQSDIKWQDANNNGYGTWFVDIDRSDYSDSQVYYNHIYVYDYANNSAVAIKDIRYETDGPVISNQTVSNISGGGFRFSCKVTDDNSIKNVSIAVWSAKNGQDDLKWYDLAVSGEVASASIPTAYHNNETGNYIIHTYAYDVFDNCTAVGSTALIQDSPVEITSVEYHGNTYSVYSSGMNWDEAKSWCEEQGGHLATITTESEWNNVKGLLEEFNGIRCWLGAESTSGELRWVTGETLGFKNWAEGQPDNSDNQEFYLGTWDPTSEILDCYLWNDYTNVGDKVGGFMMEIESSEGSNDCQWGVVRLLKKPACTATGIKTYTCTVCGKTKEETIPATGHSWKSATCTAKKTCSTCGATEGNALGHSYTSKVTKAATCTENGVRTYTCSRCSNSYTETISATGHTEIIDKAISPSCTKTGLTEGKHCSVCDVTLLKQTEVKALGHTEAITKGYEATCTEDGLTDSVYCSVCKEVLTKAVIIGAKGHSADEDWTTISTSDAGKITQVKYCTDCGTVVETREITQDITNLSVSTDPTEVTTESSATTEPVEVTTESAVITEPSESISPSESVKPSTDATEKPSESVSSTEPSTSGTEKPTASTEPSTPDETKPSEPVIDKGLLGDVNGDGKVNIKDVTLIQKVAAKILELTEDETLRADVNADTKISIKDATAIQKYVAKIETGFPIGETIVSKKNN